MHTKRNTTIPKLFASLTEFIVSFPTFFLLTEMLAIAE